LIYSIFHTISSFNNAGFDIFTNGEYSLLYFHQDALFMILTMILIILGGIGFIVMIDIYKKRRWSKFSFHTKVVLIMSLILLVIGTLLVKLGYYISGNQISWLDACFQSVTCRTAGFASVDLASLSSNHVAYLTMLFLMFIGAAPCSTGGGFKVTSFFVLVVMGYNFIQGKRVHVLKRKISQESIFKAYVLFFFEMMYILIAILVISCFESIYQADISLLEIIFEVVSGFATVGLSLGITSSLCIFSKIILVITMFIGRLGPLTLLSLWNNRSKAILDRKIDYAEGKIIIG
jgi:trk system potassium uptake protein TrkH